MEGGWRTHNMLAPRVQVSLGEQFYVNITRTKINFAIYKKQQFVQVISCMNSGRHTSPSCM